MQDVFILSAVRTPIGKFGGKLAGLSSPDLGVVAAEAALARAGIQPGLVEETIFGSARQAGNGPNPSRQVSVRAGVPKEVPAYTVNQACASGMKAIALGAQEIADGNMDCVLAGGTESMSRVPYYLDGGRWGYRLGNQELVDGMYRDGFLCKLCDMVMGETAEILAEQYKISRLEQDQFALRIEPRLAPGIVQQHQRQQTAPFGAAWEQVNQHPAQADGLLTKLMPGERFTAGRSVTLVENQVDHCQQRVQPFREQIGGRYAIGNARAVDFCPRSRQPLRHCWHRYKKRPCDLRCGKPAQRMQRQRDLRIKRQRGMATGEHQFQTVIGNRVIHIGFLVVYG